MWKNLKFSNIKEEVILLIFAILLFLPPLLRPIGFVASSFMVFALLAVFYFWDRTEILIAALLVSPIVKMLEINPLPKWLDMTLLLYILVFGSFLFQFTIDKKKFTKFNIVDLFFLLFTFVVVISYFYSPFEVKEYATFKLVRYLVLYVPIYFIPRLIKDEKGYAEISKGIILFGFISGVLLLLFFSTGYDMKHGGLNYLTVAKITGVVAIFTLTEIVRVKSLSFKVIFALMFLFQLFILLRTGSRGGMLSFLIAFFIFTVITYKQHLFKGLIFVGVTAVVFIVILLNSPRAYERVMQVFSLHKGGSINFRIEMLAVAKTLIAERWLTGVGLGGFFKYHYLKYPHNLLVESFVETGITGFLSLLAVYLGTLLAILKDGVKSVKERSVYSPFYLSCVFVIVYHMTSFGLEWSRILFFFIGTVIAISYSQSD